MTFQIPDWLEYLTGYLTLFSMLYLGFVVPESFLRPDTKRQIGAWLRGKHTGTERLLGPKWTDRFLKFVDTIFVPPKRRTHSFPVPGLVRAAVVSLIFTSLLVILYSSLGIIQLDPLKSLIPLSLPMHQRLIISLVFFLFFFGTMNLAADYISILETRYVIGLARKHRWPYLFMAVDLMLTFVIAFLFFSIGFLILYHLAQYGLILYAPTPDVASKYLSALDEAISLHALPATFIDVTIKPRSATFAGFITVSIHATFLTSIWLLLYIIADVAIRLVTRLHALRLFLDRHVLLEEHPLSVMGWLLSALMTICFGVYIAISWIVGANLWR